jgi:serine protease Do
LVSLSEVSSSSTLIPQVAAESGLSAGDVILDVGGSVVKTPVDFYQALTGVQSHGKRVALARVKSNDATRFIAIPVG